MTTPGRPTLLIADDDVVVRTVLSSQLAPHFDVIGHATTAPEAMSLAHEHQPDVALVDVQMPGGGARAAIPGIAVCSRETRAVVLSGDESSEEVLELLTAGAIAYIRKGCPASQIAQTLLKALELDAPSSPQLRTDHLARATDADASVERRQLRSLET